MFDSICICQKYWYCMILAVNDLYDLYAHIIKGCVKVSKAVVLYDMISTIMMTSSNGNIFCVTDPLNSPGEFPTQRPVTRSFDIFFDLRLNKPLSKQSWDWWFETLSRSLWRHRNDAGGSDELWRKYHKISDISHTLVYYKIVYHSDVVGASSVGATPTTSSFSTEQLPSKDCAKTTRRQDEKHLNFGIGPTYIRGLTVGKTGWYPVTTTKHHKAWTSVHLLPKFKSRGILRPSG